MFIGDTDMFISCISCFVGTSLAFKKTNMQGCGCWNTYICLAFDKNNQVMQYMKKLLFTVWMVISGWMIMYAQLPVHVLIPYEGEKDYTSLVYQQLQDYPSGNLILEFEQGIYHFYPEKSKALYMQVSNNDNSYKHVAFYLDDMRNVEIRGNKTSFIFHGAIIPFYMNNCCHITLCGIDIDYDTSFVLEGVVVASDSVLRYFDIKLPDNRKYMIQGKRLFYQGYNWSQSLGDDIIFDFSTRAPYYNTAKYYHAGWKNELTAEEFASGIIRLSDFNGREVPPVGSVFIDKGPADSNRLYPGIVIHSSNDIMLIDMNVYAAGAMALIAEYTENVTLKRFNVCLRNGSDRYISSSADATHFVNCRGRINFNHCLFENMLDDATNVHGTYMCVDSIVNSNCLAVCFGHRQQRGFCFASPGDTLQLIGRDDLLPGYRFTVKKLEIVNDNYYLIYSKEPLPILPSQRLWALENLTYTPSVVMRNCIVRNNRARSILLSTPRSILIENNYFDSMMAGILIAGDANTWFESGNVNDVIIRNNTFVDMGKGGENPQSALQISPEIPICMRKVGYYHGRILFENNTVRSFDSQVIYALSVKELIIRNNHFIQSKKYAPIFKGLSYIDIQHCLRFEMYGNTFEGEYEPQISVLECKDVIVGKQKGFRQGTVKAPNRYYYKQ